MEDRPFVCEICNLAFTKKDNLTQHKVVHTNEKPYVCAVCQRGFSQKMHLAKHARVHEGRRHVCDVCQKTFPVESLLLKHSRVHTSERPYVCVLCGKSYRQKQNLELHHLSHRGELPYVCDYCEKPYTQKRYLDRHVAKHIHIANSLVCPVCQKSFRSKYLKKKHLLSHNQNDEASGNAKEETKKIKLNRPLLKNTEKKPHVWDLCLEKFSEKNGHGSYYLQDASSDYLSDRFFCTLCQKSFISRSVLNRHMFAHGDEEYFVHYETTPNEENQSSASELKEKLFICKKCNEMFEEKDKLDQHLPIHRKTKPHIWDICLERLSRK